MPSDQGHAFGSETVYAVLRQEILHLTLAPGARLDESALTARFSVSRTPVREALIRLSAEGLVVSAKGQGASVAPLDLSTLRPFFEALDLLQRAISRLAALRRTEALLEQIEAHCLTFERAAAARDPTAANEANFAFHLAIAEAAQSAHLLAAYERCLGEGLRLSFLCYSDQTGIDASLTCHLERTMAEHRALLGAIRLRDGEAAERIAGDHLDLFRSRMSNTLMSPEAVRPVRNLG